MTNNWSDPLANTLGSQAQAPAMMSHPFQVNGQQPQGGFAGLRQMAMQKLNPMMSNGGFSSIQPMGTPQFAAPQTGQNWGDIVSKFQQQIMNGENQFQQQAQAWQRQAQMIAQQQAAQQIAQQAALQQAMAQYNNPAPVASSPASAGSMRLYGDGSAPSGVVGVIT